MTLSADTNADNEHQKPEGTPGTALASSAGAGGIGPFLAAAGEKAERPGVRSVRSRLLDYSAHAAMIVGLLGLAWTLGDHVVKRPTAAQIEAPAAAVRIAAKDTPKVDETADLRRTNRQIADEIASLQANVASLRSAVIRDRTPEQVRALQAALDTVKSGLAATKSETGTAIAQLSGKLDKMQQPTSKMQQLVDRLGKLEHQGVDTASTGSLPSSQGGAANVARATPIPPAKPASAKIAAAEEPAKAQDPARPQVIAGWVVRDVYDGVAVIEGRRGPLEVVPGVSIPGAGIVKSIDRRGSGWTVTTTKGLLAYAAPPRDYRRGVRDTYPGYDE